VLFALSFIKNSIISGAGQFCKAKIFLRRSLKMQEYCRIPRLLNKHQGNFAFQNLFIIIWLKPTVNIMVVL